MSIYDGFEHDPKLLRRFKQQIITNAVIYEQNILEEHEELNEDLEVILVDKEKAIENKFLDKQIRKILCMRERED